jgi:hypothetical protein
MTAPSTGRPRRPRTRRRFRDSRGATLVEAAIIAPILFVLVLGILEFGMGFRDYLTVGDAVSDTAKVGAIQGNKIVNGANADFEMLRRFRQATSAFDTDSIDRIVIFKASAPGAGDPESQVPAACKNGTAVAGVCNVYEDVLTAYLAVEGGNTGYFDCTGGPATSWCPTSRDDGPNPNEVDYLGVYVRAERPMVTGMFGDSFTAERASIVRLEPGTIS